MSWKRHSENGTGSVISEFVTEAKATQALEAKHKNKLRRRLGWSAVLFLLLGCASYVAGAYYLADKVPANTQISGVAVGGLSADKAAEKLETALADRLTGVREVTVNGSRYELTGADLVVALDAQATFRPVVGFSLDPRRVWAHIAGGKHYTGVVKFTDKAARKALSELGKEADTPAVNSQISFNAEENKFEASASQAGTGIEQTKALQVLRTNWLGKEKQINLPVGELVARPTQEALEDYISSTLYKVLEAPLAVRVSDKRIEVESAQVAALVSVEVEKDALVTKVDAQKLGALVDAQVGELLQEPVDAQINIVNHERVEIVPSQDGQGVDNQKLAQDFSAAVAGDYAEILAQVTEKEASLTTEEAQALGVKERIVSFTTDIPYDEVRNHNIRLGSQLISNRVILPGEEFGLLKFVGEVSAERGFKESGVTINGFFSKALGGGLSQLATNTFNAGYRSGMEDVYHQPHSNYIPRYPRVLEATIWQGSFDMIWRNNTPYGVVIDAYMVGNVLYTDLWSTKHWDVEYWIGEPRNYVPAEIKFNPNPDCRETQPGNSGFTADAGRTVRLAGEVVEESTLTWTYIPTHGAKCTKDE